MALSRGKAPLFDTVNTKKQILNGLGATATVSVDDSFETVVLDRAAGIIVTLPLAVPGLVYDFTASVSVTTNNYKIITGAATEFLVGGVSVLATGSTTFSGDGTTHRAVTMNGTTTGGLAGTTIRFTCLSTTRWAVDGNIIGPGAQATPFATS